MDIIYKNAIIERVVQLRKQYFGNRGKRSFAKTLGINASTYNYYEKDRIPPIKILLKISEVTGADLNWLLTGRKNNANFTFMENNSFLNSLEKLTATNPDILKAVEAFVELLCRHKEIMYEIQDRQAFIEPEKSDWIPVLGRTAAGMVHFWNNSLLPQPTQAITDLEELVKKYINKDLLHSADITLSVDLQVRLLIDTLKNKKAELIQVSGQEHQEIVEFVQCIAIHQMFPDSFALRVDGDSMSPRINDSDIVILSPSVPAAQGQIAVACLTNQIGVTCKLIRKTETDVHLIPINERYQTKIIPQKDLLWALAVLCHISV
jgi:transcriptional regulator with XRE-family HTH domain